MLIIIIIIFNFIIKIGYQRYSIRMVIRFWHTGPGTQALKQCCNGMNTFTPKFKTNILQIFFKKEKCISEVLRGLVV